MSDFPAEKAGGKMIKAGIIGFGYMGHFHYNKALQTGQAEVTAILDTDAARREEAEARGMKAFSGDQTDDFMKENFDLVIVATQNQFHAEYSIQAMKAGHSVLCEKPATLSVRELEEVIRVSNATGQLFTVHQQRRFDRDYLEVKETIDSEKIGHVHTVESRMMGERGVCFGWRADPECGGGMLYDWAPHLIDQYLQLFPGKKVISVYGRLCSILTPAVDDYVEINMMFTGNINAKIVITTFALEKTPRWYVLADRGSMKIDDISGETGGISRIRKGVKGFESVLGKTGLGPSRTMAPLEPEYIEKLPLPQAEDMSMRYWNNLVAALEGREEINVKPEEVLREMRIIEAVKISSECNEVVKTEI